MLRFRRRRTGPSRRRRRRGLTWPTTNNPVEKRWQFVDREGCFLSLTRTTSSSRLSREASVFDVWYGRVDPGCLFAARSSASNLLGESPVERRLRHDKSSNTASYD